MSKWEETQGTQERRLISRGAFMVKRKVIPNLKKKILTPNLNFNSSVVSSMYRSNNYIHLPMQTYDFIYYDGTRVEVHNNFRRTPNDKTTLPRERKVYKKVLGRQSMKGRHM